MSIPTNTTTAVPADTVVLADTVVPADTAVPADTVPANGHTDVSVGTDAADSRATDVVPADSITDLRERIDTIDAEIIALWQERAAISGRVGAARQTAGGPRLVLSREQVIMDRFRQALGPDGTQLAMLILRAGRGPL